MTVTEAALWDRLIQSGLFVPAATSSLRLQFNARGGPEARRASDLIEWLTENGLVTEFQKKLLLGGFSGSFCFGEYTLLGRRPNVADLATFSARHVPTKYQVQLCFMPGSEPVDLEIWQAVESRADHLRGINAVGSLRVHECVDLPEYRFVAIDGTSGQSLDERLGPKGRISWTAACNLVDSLAQAIEEIHLSGLVHGNINGREVFVESHGAPRLAPPLWPTRLTYSGGQTLAGAEPDWAVGYVPKESIGRAIEPGDDVYAMAALLFRVIRGEPPHAFLASQNAPSSNVDAAIEKLAKYEVPKSLQQLIQRSLVIDAADRIKTVSEFRDQLRKIAPLKSSKPGSTEPSTQAAAYAEWLNRWRLNRQAKFAMSSPIPNVEPASPRSESVPKPMFDLAPNSANDLRARPRKTARSNWVIWVSCAAAFLLSLIVISKFFNRPEQIADNTPALIPKPDSARSAEIAAPDNETPIESGTKVLAETTRWTQKLVDDDGTRLWQSPTNGPTIDFSLLPPGASIVIVIRPREMSAQTEFSRIAQAFGAEFQTLVTDLAARIPVPWESIEQLVIGFYPTEQLIYQTFFVVRLAKPIDDAELATTWTAQGFAVDPSRSDLWTRDQEAYAIRLATPDSNLNPPANPDSATVSEFVFGTHELAKVALQVTARNSLTGPLAHLISRTDRDRHITVLALKAGLTNEMGQNLLPGRFRSLFQQIPLFLEDQVRALALSFHIDNGNYVEVALDQTADIKSTALREAVNAKLKSARDQLVAHIATLPQNPFWEKVQQRYDNMLGDLMRHLRIGVEYDQVILNAWLPNMAAHNLVAATELMLSSNPGAEVTANVAGPSKLKTPLNIDQLLEIPRTIQNDNPPDLNILIDSLQADIKDDYPNLPFDFEIRLSNIDLSEAGITRNQRPTSLALIDQSLSQVLTQICFQANPDKNAAGPEDSRCKLIWVVTRDDEKNLDQILITTRDAATKNGWKLPVAFGAGNK